MPIKQCSTDPASAKAEYAKSISKTTAALTVQEKRQAVLIAVTEKLKAFDLDLRIEGITRDQADHLLGVVKLITEVFGGTMAGGIVEVRGDEET